MKRKYILLISTFFLWNIMLFPQINPTPGSTPNTGSVLTHKDYFANPSSYLAKINQENITTGALIDRTFFGKEILASTGTKKVMTQTIGTWTKIFNDLKYSSYDTTAMIDLDSIYQRTLFIRHIYNAYPIAFLEYKINRINQSALDMSELIEQDEYLLDISATPKSYHTDQVFAATCLLPNVYGDKVNFYIGNNFIFSNNKSHKIKQIEIDFGNGLGYISIENNNYTSVSFDSGSGFINAKIKATFTDNETGKMESLYSHFTFYHTGSDAVPLPDNLPSTSKKWKGDIAYDFSGNYPDPEWVEEEICIIDPYDGYEDCYWTEYYDYSNSFIQYYVLYAPQNTEKTKLRRPFIICDGFDPGNKRSYYEHIPSDIGDYLPKDRDWRGIFQILDGQVSPWYVDKPNANVVQKLRNDGYDIIVINWRKGAGDIPTNATMLRSFMKEILNSPTYRDNKTEEAIFVGPSMGGLISRMALATMEQNNENHYIKTWISFDSPQKGAYIPLGLQHAINFLSDLTNIFNLSENLRKAEASSKAALNKLNSKAAKQMLIYHYSNTGSVGSPTPYYSPLYSTLDNLGYPKISKNYGITNGGNSILYNETGSQILGFKSEYLNWLYVYSNGNINSDGNHKIFEGSKWGFGNDEELFTNSQTAFENAPGGWLSTPYTLNFNEGNAHSHGESDKKYNWATFMVTSSAFGQEVTRENVHLTHTAYTNCNDNSSGKIKTPFDAIRGMNENEEHVRISKSTGIYLQNELRYDFNNSQRPRVRDGQVLNQSVNGKVAYRAKEIFTFGDNGNSFTINSEADVTAKAGEKIIFKPGFKVEHGADFIAGIGEVDYGTIGKGTPKRTGVHYSEDSPYNGQIFSYVSDSINPILLAQDYTYNIFPNPFKDTFKVQLKGNTENVSIEIYNAVGNIIFASKFKDEIFINMQNYPKGFYYCKIGKGLNMRMEKIIKL